MTTKIYFTSATANSDFLQFDVFKRHILRPYGIEHVINLVEPNSFTKDGWPGKYITLLNQLHSKYGFDDFAGGLNGLAKVHQTDLQYKRILEENFLNRFLELVRNLAASKILVLTRSGTTVYRDPRLYPELLNSRNGRLPTFRTSLYFLASHLFDYYEDIDVTYLKVDKTAGVRRISNHDLFIYGKGNTSEFREITMKNIDYLKKLLDE